MKESWLLYDYVRRCWLWLLMASLFGALAGISYYSVQKHPVVDGYTATAEVAIENPVSRKGNSPSVSVNLSTSAWPTEQAAVADIAIKVGRIVGYSEAPVIVRQVKLVNLDKSKSGVTWWKAVVLGSFIGSLLVMGWLYIWEDARAFHQHRRQMGSSV